MLTSHLVEQALDTYILRVTPHRTPGTTERDFRLAISVMVVENQRTAATQLASHDSLWRRRTCSLTLALQQERTLALRKPQQI